MPRLNVYRDIEGAYELVGHIGPTSDDIERPQFSYDEGYLVSASARAICLSMPLQREPFNPRPTRSFFEALLPEGDMRTSFDQAGRHSADQYAAEIGELGDETIGALVIEPEGVLPGTQERYDPIEESFLDDFSIMPASVALKAGRGSRLSLAGAMAKVGLYYDPEGRKWYYPRGTAPSTHILKASAEAFPGQVFNEAVCMRVAGVLGIEAAPTALIRCPSTERVILASRRFDRPYSERQYVDGLHRPVRLHQVDMCQALGYMNSEKYDEAPNENLYLAAVGRVVGAISGRPASDRRRLFDLVVFNTLIGNCDAHLKNYGLVYDPYWDYARISPLYDAISTTIWTSLSQALGLSFAGKTLLARVTRDDFASLAVLLKAGNAVSKWAERACEMARSLTGSIEQVRDELVAEGFPEVRRMADRILGQTDERLKRIFGAHP